MCICFWIVSHWVLPDLDLPFNTWLFQQRNVSKNFSFLKWAYLRKWVIVIIWYVFMIGSLCCFSALAPYWLLSKSRPVCGAAVWLVCGTASKAAVSMVQTEGGLSAYYYCREEQERKLVTAIDNKATARQLEHWRLIAALPSAAGKSAFDAKRCVLELALHKKHLDSQGARH